MAGKRTISESDNIVCIMQMDHDRNAVAWMLCI
jgi:hypothetical protein